MNKIKKLLFIILLFNYTIGIGQQSNNIYYGKIVFSNSKKKPAIGVKISAYILIGEKKIIANSVYTNSLGEYQLKFPIKKSISLNGKIINFKIGKTDINKLPIEVVNSEIVEKFRIPNNPEDISEIEVCKQGERDYYARIIYNILKPYADFKQLKLEKEIEFLINEQVKDYKRISHLSNQLLMYEKQRDSLLIWQKSYRIASMNEDNASDVVRNALQLLKQNKGIDSVLAVLDDYTLDKTYNLALNKKKKAEDNIKKVIDGYKLKIELLNPNYKFEEILYCYDKIISIYKENNYNIYEFIFLYNDIAEIYFKIGKFDIAENYLTKPLWTKVP